MRTPPHLPREVLTELVEEYMQEVRRIKRLELREAIRYTYQAEGSPVPEEEELEAHIDVLEALFDAGHDDPDKVMQLIDALDWSPEGKLPSDQIVLSLENYRVRSSPRVINDAT